MKVIRFQRYRVWQAIWFYLKSFPDCCFPHHVPIFCRFNINYFTYFSNIFSIYSWWIYQFFSGLFPDFLVSKLHTFQISYFPWIISVSLISSNRILVSLHFCIRFEKLLHQPNIPIWRNIFLIYFSHQRFIIVGHQVPEIQGVTGNKVESSAR